MNSDKPSYPIPLWKLERDAIINALRYFNWSRVKAAEALEMSIRGIRVKIRHYQAMGFEIPEFNGVIKYLNPGGPKDVRPGAWKVMEPPMKLTKPIRPKQ